MIEKRGHRVIVVVVWSVGSRSGPGMTLLLQSKGVSRDYES